MSDDGYHGHLTHKDGSHTPLSKDDADAIWKHFEEEDAKRAEEMPEAWDATRQIIRAKERLRRLGWSEGGGIFRIGKGDTCAVMELGSTGMWSGWLDDEGKYVHYCDCVSERRKVWLKPLSDLTEAEKVKLAEGDKDAAEWMEQQSKMFAEMAGDGTNE